LFYRSIENASIESLLAAQNNFLEIVIPRRANRDEKEADARRIEKRRGAAGIFIPAGLFIGFGAGFLFGNVPAGMFLGLGLGFLLFGIAALSMKK
jgi:hypothetical protein